jgi:1,4-dihydroxy-2-naphthoate polyprenyltransferase
MTVKQWFIVWLKAARAPFLIVSFLPALLGGAIAYYHAPQSFNLLNFILVTIGVVMAHSAADFVDDYFDYKTGNLGNKEKQFHDSPLIDGSVTLRQVLIATIICMVIALGIGVYLLIEIGMPVLYMALLGAFIVLFYTSPPVKLNYRGLGESALFIGFGPALVFGVYYVLNPTFSWEPLLASIPLGIFTMNVGLVSNTFDYHDDVSSGKKCIPVRFGQANAARLLTFVSIFAYLLVIASVIMQWMPVWTLIALAGLPLSFSTVKKIWLYEDTANYTKAMTHAIGLTSVTGILMIVAYLLQIYL